MVLGIDPSLASTGYVLLGDAGPRMGRIAFTTLRGMERLLAIEGRFIRLLEDTRPRLVAYEDYAMRGKGRVFDLGELGGLLKTACYRRGVPLLLVPPMSLKLFATGSGSVAVKKPQIRAAIEREWGETIKQPDIADAYVLARMGETYLRRRVPRHRARARAMAGCHWVPGRVANDCIPY